MRILASAAVATPDVLGFEEACASATGALEIRVKTPGLLARAVALLSACVCYRFGIRANPRPFSRRASSVTSVRS